MHRAVGDAADRAAADQRERVEVNTEDRYDLERFVAAQEAVVVTSGHWQSFTIVADLDGVSAQDVLGEIDTRKLRSAITLFLRAAPDESVFGQVLDHWFDGMPDTDTERLL